MTMAVTMPMTMTMTRPAAGADFQETKLTPNCIVLLLKPLKKTVFFILSKATPFAGPLLALVRIESPPY